RKGVVARGAPPRGPLRTWLKPYKESSEFLGLAEVTRRSYVWYIKRIEKEFGDYPLSGLTDRRTRGIFMEWRDRVAVSSGRRLADYSWSVLARGLSRGVGRRFGFGHPFPPGGLPLPPTRGGEACGLAPATPISSTAHPPT